MIYLGREPVGVDMHGYTMDDFANPSRLFGNKPLELPDYVTSIEGYAFIGKNFTKISGKNITTVGNYAFAALSSSGQGTNAVVESVNLPNLETIGSFVFWFKKFSEITVKITAKTVGGSIFERAVGTSKIIYTRAISIGSDQIYGNSSVNTIHILTPDMPLKGITSNAFRQSSNLTDIYVAWSEGAVNNAPWGATNATIHYDTVFDADGEVVTQNA